MGFIGSLLSNAQGAGFQAQGANIQQPVGTQDVTQANQLAQQALQQQLAFAHAAASQGGLGNLSSVFNQLQGVANGTGPNPAQTMLNQATGQNNAAQAALMAGQRGASANAGLIARQAGMQGAANQQNALGQGASMQAQQQLSALSGLGNVAGQQVGAQQGALMGANQAAQGFQGNLLSGIGAQNNANVGMQSNINNANAGIAQGNQKTQAGLFGGVANAAGGALQGLVGLAHGGEVAPSGPRSHVTKHILGYAEGGPIHGEAYAQNLRPVPGAAEKAGDSLSNDTVPAMLSPGEIIIPRSHAMDPEKAAAFAYQVAMKNRKGK